MRRAKGKGKPKKGEGKRAQKRKWTGFNQEQAMCTEEQTRRTSLDACWCYMLELSVLMQEYHFMTSLQKLIWIITTESFLSKSNCL